MAQQQQGTNTLYYELRCPRCGQNVQSGIGFRLGSIRRLNYQLGEKLVWDGPNCRPSVRPQQSTLKTIGYFNCDNPRCESWQDCYPDVQEAVITVVEDVITEVSPIVYKPEELTFAIIEPEGIS